MAQEDILRYEKEQLEIEVRSLRKEKQVLHDELRAIQQQIMAGVRSE